MAKDYSKLLIDEHPLQVLPTLAVKIGLNNAIVLQQVHYWLKIAEHSKDNRKLKDGRWWVYNTYKEWQENNFPFWSERTVMRIFRNLEKAGILIADKPGAGDWDHTKWYAIDYEVLDGTIDMDNLSTSDETDWDDRYGQDGRILNKNLETTTESIANPFTSPPRRTAEQVKADVLESLARGINRDIGLKEQVEKTFSISPNWDTSTARNFIQWLKGIPSDQSVATFAAWWRKNDWRGKQGQPPTLPLIRELWPQAFTKPIRQEEYFFETFR